MSLETDAIRVLVTGVGAIIGQGVVKSLRGLPGVTIVGLDRNPNAFGRHACDAFYAKPALAESEVAYGDFLLHLVELERIDLILLCIEQDVFYFDGLRELFENSRAVVALNNSRLIQLAQDKWHMHEALLQAGLPVIPSCIEHLGPVPLLCKPRRGSGGRDQSLIESEEDMHYWANKLGSNFMLQRLIGNADEEYTVGLFGYGDGQSSRPAILRRTLGPGGATWCAQSIVDDVLVEAACQELTAHFRPVGPTNYQFRKAEGRVWLLEINPRLSSSVSLRAALGCNEAAMSIDFFCSGLRPDFNNWRLAHCTRYIEDHIEYL
jgi:carbamoyl-phosphate synthase large subunit